jgi:hypothetical protein
MRFCVVFLSRGKEVSRSEPLSFEAALRIAQQTNGKEPNPHKRVSSAYVEEASTVKHLPIRSV